MNELDHLLRLPLFAEFDADDMTLLRRVMSLKRHPAGHRFVEEGKRPASSSAGMCVLLEGEVRVFAKRPAGGYAVDKRMGVGSVFGVVALIDDGPRSATVDALTPCLVAFLGKPGFRELYASGLPVSARFQRLLARQMAADLRHMGGLLQTALQGDDSALLDAYAPKA